MSPDEMETLARGYFEAVEQSDRSRLLEIFTPDVRWRVPRGAIEPYAGLHEGAETVVDLMLGAVSGAFVPGSQKTQILSFAFAENLAVAEADMRAETPSGALYENAYTFFFEFENGRIAEIREHVDTRHAARFFGAGSE